MTTGTPQRSVLLLGESQRIVDECVAVLRDLGYTAQGTNDFFSDITRRFDVTRIDLVSMGGLVLPDRKAELKQQIGAINPRVIFIDGLAGIPGLIAGQVQEAFTADRQDPARAPPYTPGDRSIRLTLRDPAAVTGTLWRRTSLVPPDPESDSLVLFGGQLPSGEHAIPVPGHIPPPQRRQTGHVRPAGSPPCKPVRLPTTSASQQGNNSGGHAGWPASIGSIGARCARHPLSRSFLSGSAEAGCASWIRAVAGRETAGQGVCADAVRGCP